MGTVWSQKGTHEDLEPLDLIDSSPSFISKIRTMMQDIWYRLIQPSSSKPKKPRYESCSTPKHPLISLTPVSELPGHTLVSPSTHYAQENDTYDDPRAPDINRTPLNSMNLIRRNLKHEVL
jgi:hypothetical protein